MREKDRVSPNRSHPSLLCGERSRKLFLPSSDSGATISPAFHFIPVTGHERLEMPHSEDSDAIVVS